MRETMELSVRLMIFALVAALMLAVVNTFTADQIAENTREKINASRKEVIGDYEFVAAETDISGAESITGVYAAMDGGACVGYVYELEARGYGGTIYLAAGVDAEGCVTGVAVSSHSETKGLGSADEARFIRAFTGIVAEDGALGVNAMAGATVSSNAVKNAVDEALTHYNENFAEGAGE